jgi:hypothetical protein
VIDDTLGTHENWNSYLSAGVMQRNGIIELLTYTVVESGLMMGDQLMRIYAIEKECWQISTDCKTHNNNNIQLMGFLSFSSRHKIE